MLNCATGWFRPLLSVGLLLVAVAARAELVVHYRPPESEHDTRYQYDTAVLQLALEKTRSKYGPYRLEPVPEMTFPRAIQSVRNNTYPNFFIKLSYEDEHVFKDNMTFARFPVDLGIVGYRVCFANPDSLARLKSVRQLKDLQRFTIGQGAGWADVKILRAGGFEVMEVPTYESLFKMVALRRFDLFCRGTNELRDEYLAHRDIPGLTYDQSLSIAYPLPRVFFTHKSNQAVARRIEEGLRLAWQDGSLQREWRRRYQPSIDFVRLDRRRIFWLENPLIAHIGFDFRRYFVNPKHLLLR